MADRPDKSGVVRWYDMHAEELASHYEAVDPEAVHHWLVDLLPAGRSSILDIGAGTGRDATWLAARGHAVVAIEPSSAMRALAERLHPDGQVHWMADTLPGLEAVLRSGLSFDLVLLSAVWMHVAPEDRARAFRKIVTLLRPGGLIAMTLRHADVEPGRSMFPVSAGEIEQLARDHGAFVERRQDADDRLGREGVRWTQMAVRLPDDGTGALPLLRHVILNDDKSSTYKLALLRTLCRIADGAAGLARENEDETVSVPLGLVALTWIRLFKPLLAKGLPQAPRNIGDTALGFVKDGFRGLGDVSHLDLRIGARFSGHTAVAIRQAVKDAARTIASMPATYMKYPNGGPILPAEPRQGPRQAAQVLLDEEWLAAFGELRIPRHLWTALRRHDIWIEPALVAEWSRLIKVYAARQGRTADDADIAAAMTWSEPSRDVRVARERALQLSGEQALLCVWSGKRLGPPSLDLDHCMPWSAWPCGDLWNLMPAHRLVNQNQKREKLPSDALLRSSRSRIMTWWQEAYDASTPAMKDRFWLEAASSLPGAGTGNLDDIFDAVRLQRMRLHQDQQVPEWAGEGYRQ